MRILKAILISFCSLVLVLGATFGITYAVDKDLALSWIGIEAETPSDPEQPNPEQPGTDVEEPDTEEPGTDTEQPGTDVEEPDTEEPGTDVEEPDTEEPGTDTEEPGGILPPGGWEPLT